MEENLDDILTVGEVAKILRVDDTTVRRYITGGRLRALGLPTNARGRRSYRVKRRDLNESLTIMNP